ncbi:globin-like isoform X3 [Biomphalaria glabrata]|nr:globin-like isoform X3 [Biomphalaria glabrata]KAI8782051.1 hemoglobin type 2 [Biomphalaria glabrata]
MLKECWRSVVGQLIVDDQKVEDFGKLLLLWLLDNVPNAKKPFKKFDANVTKASLTKNPVFLNHCRMVGMYLGQMVELLDKPVELEMLTHQVAINHLSMKPSVGTAYFDPFQEKFPRFMSETLQKPLDDPLIKAWDKFLMVLTGKVKKSEKMIAKSQKCAMC